MEREITVDELAIVDAHAAVSVTPTRDTYGVTSSTPTSSKWLYFGEVADRVLERAEDEFVDRARGEAALRLVSRRLPLRAVPAHYVTYVVPLISSYRYGARK